ncbi:ABC transporter permease [Bosea sp. (in: a-proteobacteria)]|uniref:ABC transporter permease n=1 Tax=Bosea sp. (in: a-proteobacteria) TaxID=1871050 RepID=UPI002FCC5987
MTMAAASRELPLVPAPPRSSLAAQVGAAERRHLWRMLALLAPSVLFTALFFAAPLALFMFRSVDNPEIPGHLPRTAAVMQGWSGEGEPNEAAFTALAADLRAIRETPALGLIGRRLNYALPGFRGLLTRTARRLPAEDAGSVKAAFLAIDQKWRDPAVWGVLHQQSGRLTSFYLLTALDLEKSPEGEIRQVAPEQRIFIDLYGRTLTVSLGVTALCLLIAYPVAAVMARAGPRAASWMLMLVLVPFWTSLLVRSTAWVILLQNEGLVNKSLIALGLIDKPLPLIFNRAGVFIAMVHVLLPYAILPIYSVMKGISGNHLRAAASLGAPPLRVFRTVYLPLTLPGVVAGGTLVFVLSVGFYVTPALVGGPGDQMIGYFIAYFTNSAVNWGLASALGAFLLLVVALIYLALGKLVGFDRLRVR